MCHQRCRRPSFFQDDDQFGNVIKARGRASACAQKSKLTVIQKAMAVASQGILSGERGALGDSYVIMVRRRSWLWLRFPRVRLNRTFRHYST